MADSTVVMILDAIGDVRNDIGQVRREHREEIRNLHRRIDVLSAAVARLDERSGGTTYTGSSGSGEHPSPVATSLAKRVRETAPKLGASVGGGAIVVALVEIIGPLVSRLFGGG